MATFAPTRREACVRVRSPMVKRRPDGSVGAGRRGTSLVVLSQPRADELLGQALDRLVGPASVRRSGASQQDAFGPDRNHPGLGSRVRREPSLAQRGHLNHRDAV